MLWKINFNFDIVTKVVCFQDISLKHIALNVITFRIKFKDIFSKIS